MATIEPYQTKAGKRWRVRYRKPDRSQTDKRGFKTKRDAQLFAATVETSKATGTYVDPTAGKVTIKELGEKWLKRQADWKPSYRRSVESSWQTHVVPKWGSVRVSSIRKSEVQEWITNLNRSHSTASRCLTILSSILDDAVSDGLIYANVAKGVALPKRSHQKRVYLTIEELERFANATTTLEHAAMIRILGYCGLRWGELVGLHGEDIDFERKRISIVRNAVEVGSQVIVGTPKSHEVRTVPLPDFLIDDLRAVYRDGILFPGKDGYQRRPRASSNKRSWWRNAMLAAGLKLSPHSLRRTAASLAVKSGANVKAVQRMLGHSSAAMTLDRYADLFDSDLDDVAMAMTQLRATALNCGQIVGKNDSE
mgnify:CR=1 FL=1